MKDFVPNGTGNSRYLKSAIPSDITFAQLVAMLRAGSFPIDFNGTNPAGYSQLGTALNKANLLTDGNVTALASALGFAPSSDPTISEVWSALASVILGTAHGGTGANTALGGLKKLMSEYVPDLNDLFGTQNSMCTYHVGTSHTPYNEGITSYSAGLVITSGYVDTIINTTCYKYR
jgi:hypothetical protein